MLFEMFRKNTMSYVMIIIVILVIDVIIVTSVPLFKGQMKTLEERDSGIISPRSHQSMSIELKKGDIKFTYFVSYFVDVFIMTETQYHRFSENINEYADSEAAVNNAYHGILTAQIEKSGNYHFIILNESDRNVTIQSYKIEFAPSNLTLWEFFSK